MLKRFLSSGVVSGLFISTAFANMVTNGEQFGFIGGNLGLNSVINKSTETLNWTGGPGSSNTRYAEQGVAGALVIGYVKRFQRVVIGLNGALPISIMRHVLEYMAHLQDLLIAKGIVSN